MVSGMKIMHKPGELAEMPDVLSRLSDYHEGKGASELQEIKVQALPNTEMGPEFLRAAIKVTDKWAEGPIDV